jgi:phage terminase large subunit-like protein
MTRQRTRQQLIEVRDLILPQKPEYQRELFKGLDAFALKKLYEWSVEHQDKHPHFYRECLGMLAIKDLYVMCDVVLGYNAKNYGSDMNFALHGEICRRLDDRPMNRQGWMIAREHLKTQVVTVADSIRNIARDPNPPGVIISGIRDNAVKMISAIKAQWETNAVLQWLYPHRLPDRRKHKWNEDVLEFAGRTVINKDPCLEARGAESELTSAHYQWVKADDLVGRENSSTDEQLAKTIDWWRKAQPTFTPNCRVDLIGTRYADGDLYGWLQDTVSDISWFIAAATKVDQETGEEVPNWPEYHTLESLQSKKENMGPHDYSCQMMLDPIPKGEEEFREDMFHLYEPEELDSNDVKHKGTVTDPAYTKKKKATPNPDSSAVMTGGFHRDGQLVVLDISHGAVGTEKTVSWMHRHQSAWGTKVGVELQSALEDYLRLHNQQNPRQYIQWTPLKHGNIDKDSRIRTLLPLAAKHRIWLPKRNPHTQTLLGQLLRFPKAKKRDLMDVLAYLPQMCRAVRLNRTSSEVKFEAYEPDSELTGY